MTDPVEVIREALTRWVYPEQNATDPEVQRDLAALDALIKKWDELSTTYHELVAEFNENIRQWSDAEAERDRWHKACADCEKVEAELLAERDRYREQVERLMNALQQSATGQNPDTAHVLRQARAALSEEVKDD